MENKKLSLLIILIFGLAFVLRTVNLGLWPIFADESIYVRWAQVMKAESTLRFLPLSDGKQPFYMWVLMPVLKFISDPLVAGRLLSALAGSFGALGIGFLVFILFKNKRMACISMLLYAVLPYSVLFSRMALVDTMLTSFVIWGVGLFILSLEKQRLDYAMFSGFAFGFAWLTKSPAMLVLLLLPTTFILTKCSKKNLGYLLVVWLMAWCMYNILRLGPEFHMIALRNKDYIRPFSDLLKNPLDPFVPHTRASLEFLWYLFTPIGLILSLWGAISGKLTHWRQRLVLISFWLIPIFAQAAVAKVLTARYLLFTVPFATILMALAIEEISQRSQKHLLVWITTTVFVGACLYTNFFILFEPENLPLPRIERAGYLEEWTAGQGIREVSKYLREQALTKHVLVGSEGYFGTPFSALEMYLNRVDNVRVIGVGSSIDKVDQRLVRSLVDNDVYLVVNSSRFHIDNYKEHGLSLISSYPKATPPSGKREYLLFFKLNAKN